MLDKARGHLQVDSESLGLHGLKIPQNTEDVQSKILRVLGACVRMMANGLLLNYATNGNIGHLTSTR